MIDWYSVLYCCTVVLCSMSARHKGRAARAGLGDRPESPCKSIPSPKLGAKKIIECFFFSLSWVADSFPRFDFWSNQRREPHNGQQPLPTQSAQGSVLGRGKYLYGLVTTGQIILGDVYHLLDPDLGSSDATRCCAAAFAPCYNICPSSLPPRSFMCDAVTDCRWLDIVASNGHACLCISFF